MLSTIQRDRAAGVLLAQACGDALGVPYEFGVRALPASDEPQMLGGGLGHFLPGEYSDDTQMALGIAWAAEKHGTLTTPEALESVARGFLEWFGQRPADVGNQTRQVLSAAERALADEPDLSPAQACTDAARDFTQTHERSAGNGALMRGGVVGLVGVQYGRDEMARVAREIAALTHADDLVLDSCVLLAEAVRVAVLSGDLNILGGLDLLPRERQAQWREWLLSVEEAHPRDVPHNGSTFGALRAAWAAIISTHDGRAGHLERALTLAVRCENDTDTVAAIAGALLGARYGASAVPDRWRRAVLGWNGRFPVVAESALHSRELMGLSLAVVGESRPG